MGAALSTLIIGIVRGPVNPWSDPTIWITVGLPTFLILFGVYLGYCGFYPQKPLGILFFQNGVELGEGSNRKLIAYSELETFICVLAEPANGGFRFAYFVARAIISFVVINPAGVGYAIGQIAAPPIYSHLTIKPHNERPLTFPLTHPDHYDLGPILPKS